MARSTNGTSDFLDAGSLAVLASATLVTIAGWMYRSAAGTAAVFGRYDAANRFEVAHLTDNVVYTVCENGSLAYGSYSNATSGWHHYGVVFDGSGAGDADRLKSYFNGINQTLGIGGSSIPSSLGATNPQYRWGLDDDNPGGTSNRFWAGSYAEHAIWNVGLTAEEMVVLAKGYSPLFIRRSALKHYWPIIGRYSPELDVIGSANLTLTGTTRVEHPRILMPRASPVACAPVVVVYQAPIPVWDSQLLPKAWF